MTLGPVMLDVVGKELTAEDIKLSSELLKVVS